MGFPIARLTCMHCNRSEPAVMYSRPRMYQLDSQTQIPIYLQTGWCFDCDGTRTIEDLSTNRPLDTIRRVAATLRSATPKRRLFRTGWECQSYSWLDKGLEIVREFHTKDWRAMGASLEEELTRLEFLSNRSAPARCLGCFGHNIVELPTKKEGEEEYQTHPGCGGRFVFAIEGSMNISPPHIKHIYRPDGTFSHDEPYEAPSLLVPGRPD